MMKKLGILMLMAVFVLFAAACDDGGNGTEDTPVDQPAEDSVDMVEEDTPPADIPVEDTTPDPVEDTTPDPVEDPIPDTPEEELGPGACGNGSVEDPERCDDGNILTEFCGTGCLEDCSLDTSLCGNGSTDPGEQCDDGNADSYDTCTTSCTTNDNGIGAPCTCTGACEAVDFTSGTINGCSAAAALADSTRTLACLRSVDETVMSERIITHSAEGECMLMALKCEGAPCILGLVPETGDVDAMTCPAGTAATTSIMVKAGMTITTKTCHKLCVTQADCRWNAMEPAGSPFAGECGQLQCGDGGDALELICGDPRNEEI